MLVVAGGTQPGCVSCKLWQWPMEEGCLQRSRARGAIVFGRESNNNCMSHCLVWYKQRFPGKRTDSGTRKEKYWWRGEGGEIIQVPNAAVGLLSACDTGPPTPASLPGACLLISVSLHLGGVERNSGAVPNHVDGSSETQPRRVDLNPRYSQGKASSQHHGCQARESHEFYTLALLWKSVPALYT